MTMVHLLSNPQATKKTRRIDVISAPLPVQREKGRIAKFAKEEATDRKQVNNKANTTNAQCCSIRSSFGVLLLSTIHHCCSFFLGIWPMRALTNGSPSKIKFTCAL